MTRQILLAVHDQPGELEMVQRELVSRYAADYGIVCERSAASALQRLDALRAAGDARVLVLFAAQEMTEMTGVEYLRRAHELHPRAQRVLLIPWGNRSASKPILKAVSLGQIDRYATVPSRPPDEDFHHLVTELLRERQRHEQAQRTVVTVIGEWWAPRATTTSQIPASRAERVRRRGVGLTLGPPSSLRAERDGEGCEECAVGGVGAAAGAGLAGVWPVELDFVTAGECPGRHVEDHEHFDPVRVR